MRVLIVPDIPNWAFDNQANSIIKYNKDIEFTKVYDNSFRDSLPIIKTFDIVYFMSWISGASFYVRTRKKTRVTMGIFSHNFEYNKYYERKMPALFEKMRGVTVSSKKLLESVNSKYTTQILRYTPPGVDDNIFIPIKNKRSKKFIVGWVGQPTKGGFPPNRPIDIKGYSHILKPLVERLKKYKDIEFKIKDNDPKNPSPFLDMPKFYNLIDVQLCTSITEGGPGTMFEAAACGIPLISTNVGRISDFIVSGENGFLTPSYSSQEEIPKILDKFEEYIVKLKNDRDLCDIIGKNNREKVEKEWSWKIAATRWKKFFEEVMNNEDKCKEDESENISTNVS